MDFATLVQKVASKIRSGSLLVVAKSEVGLDLCLDRDGHWHEIFRSADKDHGSCPIEKILMIFVCMKGYVSSYPSDPDCYFFVKRVVDYVEANKPRLTAELTEILRQLDQALTS